MRLLIITQKVDINDDNLGFFHSWLEKLAAKLEKLYIICLWKGKHRLPENAQVFSLGKERGLSKIRQFFRLQKFLFQHLSKTDGIFVHMAPLYAIIAFPLTKLFGKKLVLWYLHGSVSWKLRLAEKLVDRILTASKESCRLKSRSKIKIVGHGIDTDLFKPISKIQDSRYKILSVGRISPIKDQRTLIEAIDLLVNQKQFKDIRVKIVGSPLEDYEKEYFEELKKLVSLKGLKDYIEFVGGVAHRKMPAFYQDADLVVNLSHTGSIDKVVLEAMASGPHILTCNEAFEEILDKKYLFKKKDHRDLAQKIVYLMNAPKDESLRAIIVKDYNLNSLINKIISEFNI